MAEAQAVRKVLNGIFMIFFHDTSLPYSIGL